MANTVYSNKVIEAKAKDLLTTQVNARSMMTIDNSLTATAGMVKTINTYTYSGVAEELAVGVGNTASTRGSIAYVGKDYTVKMVQQAADYFDEDFMKDNLIVDFMLKGATQVMTNKMTSDFYAALATKGSDTNELVKGITFAKGSSLSYDVIVDAISELNIEDESKIFIVVIRGLLNELHGVIFADISNRATRARSRANANAKSLGNARVGVGVDGFRHARSSNETIINSHHRASIDLSSE